ncbi:MAG: cysteine hydrolase [Armatimonadetes bacterium]|nr:cysteine hydrolase [Armatimonadota bacterium]
MTREVEVPPYIVEAPVVASPATTAIVVVDMQHDFVTPGGALVVPDAAGTVPAIARLLARSRAAGTRIFYTQDTHRSGDPEFAIWGEHAVEGTWGWQIVESLRPVPGDQVVRKPSYDGFFETSLDRDLRAAGIRTLVVCGTVANICVLHTAGSATLRGYKVVLPVDAVSAIVPFDLEAAIRQVAFLYRGTITTTDALAWGP